MDEVVAVDSTEAVEEYQEHKFDKVDETEALEEYEEHKFDGAGRGGDK